MSRRTHSLLARRLAAGLTLCLGLPGGLFLTACSATKAAGPAAPGTPVVPVLAATVEEKDVPVQVQAIGSVESYSTVAVKTQITGELTGVFFREGQEVKKGELIFTLDKRPFEAVLKQAQSTLAKDQAQAEMARVQARRYAVLMKDGVVAKEQYDQMQSSADALDAAVEADKAAVENARVQLIYCSIDSPINGRVGSLLIHQGNMIKANDVPLVNINQIQPIRVAFTVPEQYLAEIDQCRTLGRSIRLGGCAAAAAMQVQGARRRIVQHADVRLELPVADGVIGHAVGGKHLRDSVIEPRDHVGRRACRCEHAHP